MKRSLISFLRWISLGKYQTTFYNKQRSPFYSSIIGGVITFFLLVIVGSVMIDFLASTFLRRRYNLNITGTPIDGY